jgi:hypothetical protein
VLPIARFQGAVAAASKALWAAGTGFVLALAVDVAVAGLAAVAVAPAAAAKEIIKMAAIAVLVGLVFMFCPPL